MNDSTASVKPKVANVVLDNVTQTQQLIHSMSSSVDKFPISIIDDEKYPIDDEKGEKNIQEALDIDIAGELIAPENFISTLADDDPVIQSVQTAQDVLNETWIPSLNSVKEEKEVDIKIELNQPIVKTTLHVSEKRLRGRLSRDRKWRRQYEDKLSSAVTKNGIYKTTLNIGQNDSGANRTVTNKKELLVHYKTIPPYAINGVSDEAPAIHCTGIGFLPWRADTGEILLIRCLYSENASGTIISPASDVNLQYQQRYDGWCMETKFDTKCGQLTFNARDGINHLVFSAYSDNNLWYHYLDEVTNAEYKRLGMQTKAVVNSLNANATYHLWHHRLGHPSHKIMMAAHKSCKGVPKFKQPQFFNCGICNSSKFKRKHIGLTKAINKDIKSTPPESNIQVGQHLHIDFGFVRGSDYAVKDAKGHLVTSVDGYRSYCLIIDRKSRYITVLLTKTKEPPIAQLRTILQKLQSKVTAVHSTVTTDLGGELAKSKAFCDLMMEPDVNYSLQTTGAYSSAQDGLAEKPNQDLARMMRSLLYGAGLNSKYWTYALRHSVYLKNRLPHSSLQYTTPYELMNQQKPDLSHLRAFGARVHFLHKPRTKKLDRMDNVGRFMTYKGTDKIVYIIDDSTGKERTATHVNYDEAFASVKADQHPPMATALLQSGYQPEKEEICKIQIKLLSKDAKVPQQATSEAAAMDLYTTTTTSIAPGEQITLNTGVVMALPSGYHAQIQIRSSYALKHRARVETGLIDSDYRGELIIIMSNNGHEPIKIECGDRVAQMVISKDPTVTYQVQHELSATARNKKGFGSTGTKRIQPMRQAKQPKTEAVAKMVDKTDYDDMSHMQVALSSNPFDDEQSISFHTRGKHPTQGLKLQQCSQWKDRILILGCKPGTATAKIPNWVRRLKNSVLLEVDGHPVKTVNDAIEHLQHKQRNTSVTIKVGLQQKLPMHDDQGTPMLYFDQLNTIQQHLNHIDTNQHATRIHAKETAVSTPRARLAKALQHMDVKGLIASIHGILPKNKVPSKRLTRTKLKNSDQWSKWKLSEWKQLDQYWQQNMFGDPCPLPPNANVLNLIWDYRIKDDGTYKARMVCNGKPSNKNTVVFGYTYAKSLDHVGSRIFWSSIAAKNFVVQGADASNAFAEADGSKFPLYVRANDPYREWWHEKMDKPVIPKGYVLPAHKALQGHPEAPRAWAIKIDTILREKLHFIPTTHEPCLYHGTHKGNEILFLRQVDDFAVGAATKEIATDVINTIDKYLKIKIKDLGSLTRYNGVDILQSKHYIKLHNPTYIKKIINEHSWMVEGIQQHQHPMPMTEDKEFIRKLETSDPPITEEDKVTLQVKMKFNYRQAIGELIFAMVTCRPDISFPLIKLSQYSSNPSQIHYEAVVQIFRYLHATVDDGLLYWRSTPNHSLPDHPLPKVHHDNYNMTQRSTHPEATALEGHVDSDWAGDIQHRKSVTGIILKVAGGCVLYKTKYQDTIAHSTTEAEFTAACDAAKAILYVRSILEEVNMPQDKATTLYIDNNGALLMGNAQQPTRRTRHMDIKKFSILAWIQRDLLLLHKISSSENCSDVMTKQTGRQLFYRHFDYIMGRVIPSFVKAKLKSPQVNRLMMNQEYIDKLLSIQMIQIPIL